MTAEQAAPEVFAAFCAAGLWPGLGRPIADRLAAAGITTPADVTAEKLAAVDGVSPRRAQRLVTTFGQAGEAYAVAEMLARAGLPLRLAHGLDDVLGPHPAAALEADPWRLLATTDVSVNLADRFAISRLGSAARRHDPRRGRALAVHLLRRSARDGHTVLPASTVNSALVGQGFADPAAVLAAARDGEELVEFAEGDDPLVALPGYAAAEDTIAAGIRRLQATAEPLTDHTDGAPLTDLDDAQRAAVQAALQEGVSVLIGGPGTGKSRTIAAAVAFTAETGREVAVAAPTGRAAKRLAELTDAPTSTLHRLLGAQGASGGFGRNEDWPLDADLIVVDEVSMLDVELAAALLRACPDGAHLMLVGDPAQLPSIGPGRVLADLVDAQVLPVTELGTLYRHAEGGAIARLATAVRRGELPPVDDPTREVVVVPASGAGEVARRVVQLVTDSIPRALDIRPDEVQVVTPVHRGPAGTVALNAALKQVLNPGGGAVAGFDVGDRVVATANRLDTGFANGEVGVVTAAGDGMLTVGFAGGPVSVPAREVGDLRHGWALTVHRAQGSEWPAVVAALPPEAGGLLSRPLVYTALTRAQRHLSVVHGAGPALAYAVRSVGTRPRRTRLRRLLADGANPD